MTATMHGERRHYNAGCRCDDCRAADATYQAQRRPTYYAPVTLAHVPAPGEWIEQAACKQHPVAIFFPERGEDVRPAKAVCATCPVLDACRAYALAAPVALNGVWGMLSQEERRLARRRVRLAS